VAWRFALASIAGTSHVAAGRGCDDAACCGVIESPTGEEVLVAVASDGAGSAELSSSGSKLITTVMFENIKAWLSHGGTIRDFARETMLDWLDDLRDQISNMAKADYADRRDYAATLLFAIVGREASAIGQLGDGAIVVSDGTADWSAVFWPQHGDYANQTHFVTDEKAHETLELTVLPRPVEDVVLFTDGLERVLLDFAQQRAHPPVFSRMIGPLRRSIGRGQVEGLSAQLAEYLKSRAITSHSNDDLTLVIATRGGPLTVPSV